MKTKWPSIVGQKHIFRKGGPGSGNYGHAGRPGERGGSGSGGGTSTDDKTATGDLKSYDSELSTMQADLESGKIGWRSSGGKLSPRAAMKRAAKLAQAARKIRNDDSLSQKVRNAALEIETHADNI